MNGIASTSMREKGITYKLNFGVSLPKLKEIAKQYTPNPELAELLWNEDVRELKILATLLYPSPSFTKEKAEEWVIEIQHIEIAEQFSFNLLQHTSFTNQLAKEWLSQEGYRQLIAYHLYFRLFKKDVLLSAEESTLLLNQIRQTLEKSSVPFQRIAFSTLIEYGKQTKEQAEKVFVAFADYKNAKKKEKKELYDHLFFELDE
ncbi:DNA alkylation repair protein [Parabacteroides sp. PF5-9]|uniref:DNA alkylation repair protein n=1 Tax=Parabacteroides sp. PF5-9 TaxID=1742404 RepID=UPI0024730443|nr:DNA alkylation repair protein [Parabacteroides sp. PF5-9]MDH6358859.1 3-methyladenine DNA glycosylase AlkD [Parabacteroides sp. PF5-9]